MLGNYGLSGLQEPGGVGGPSAPEMSGGGMDVQGTIKKYSAAPTQFNARPAFGAIGFGGGFGGGGINYG